MKLAIVTSQRFWANESGRYHRRSGSLRPVLLKAISKYFEKLIIVARIEKLSDNESENLEVIDIPNVEFCHLPSFSWPIGYLYHYSKIKAVMHEALVQCDVAILRGGPGLPYLGFKIATRLNVATIIHLIGSDLEVVSADKNRIKFKPLRLALAHIIHRQTKSVFASADLRASVSAYCLRLYGASPDTCVVQPNYCLTNEEFMPALDRVKKPDEPFNCLYIGRLEMPKNIQIFLKAVSKLPDNLLDISITIAGDGKYQEQLKKLVKKLGIADKVSFLGWVGKQDTLQKLYRQADLIFLLSESEGLPVSLCEAAAASVPAIASNRGGIPEFIRDGYNGYLIEPRDVQECRKRLISIMSDDSLLKSLRQNAFESAQKFHADKVGQKFHSMAKKAVANRRNKN